MIVSHSLDSFLVFFFRFGFFWGTKSIWIHKSKMSWHLWNVHINTQNNNWSFPHIVRVTQITEKKKNSSNYYYYYQYETVQIHKNSEINEKNYTEKKITTKCGKMKNRDKIKSRSNWLKTREWLMQFESQLHNNFECVLMQSLNHSVLSSVLFFVPWMVRDRHWTTNGLQKSDRETKTF